MEPIEQEKRCARDVCRRSIVSERDPQFAADGCSASAADSHTVAFPVAFSAGKNSPTRTDAVSVVKSAERQRAGAEEQPRMADVAGRVRSQFHRQQRNKRS